MQGIITAVTITVHVVHSKLGSTKDDGQRGCGVGREVRLLGPAHPLCCVAVRTRRLDIVISIRSLKLLLFSFIAHNPSYVRFFQLLRVSSSIQAKNELVTDMLFRRAVQFALPLAAPKRTIVQPTTAVYRNFTSVSMDNHSIPSNLIDVDDVSPAQLLRPR